MKTKIAPNWVVWTSLVFLCIFGLIEIYSLINEILGLSGTLILVSVAGSGVRLLFVFYIPIRIIYRYLKAK